MKNRLNELLAQIKELESELVEELQKKEAELLYEIRARKVYFERAIRKKHRKLRKRIPRYLLDASLKNVLTVPIIWSVLPPAILIDIFVSLFQAICFPVYGIPKVKRSDYVVIDRQYLRYLNTIEKINCIYCGYFNGMIAYVQEVAARTEQYWCPIKHARRLKTIHSRYEHFIEYGDVDSYKRNLEAVRRRFDDLRDEERSK